MAGVPNYHKMTEAEKKVADKLLNPNMKTEAIDKPKEKKNGSIK